MRLVSKDDIAAANAEIASIRKQLEDIEQDLANGEKHLEELNLKYSANKDVFSKKSDELKAFQKERDSLQSQLDAINSNLADKEKELKEADASGASEDVIESLKKQIEALDTSREPISAKVEDARQGVDMTEKQIKEIEIDLESISKEIDDVSSNNQKVKDEHRSVSSLLEEKLKNEALIRYEEERAERLEMIEEAFEERERMNSLLRNDHTDISSEKEDREADRGVMRAELRDQLGIEGEDSIVRGILSNLSERGADHELGIFPANEALGLSRDSIFSANLHGITDKIKEACRKGATKIIITEKEITGPIMYSLIEVGYNVSHEKRYNPGRNESTQNVIIDWAFPYSAG